MKRFKLMAAIVLGLGGLAGTLPLSLWAAELAVNSGFNNPFNDIPGREWQGQPQKIADGWQPFYIEANTEPGSGNASRLRWMSSAQFAAAFGGLDYKIEGDQSQVLWSSYEFDGGVYQQIGGLTPGQSYGFDIAIATYWRGPGYADTDGKMVRQVGIDPWGGVDPTSSNIIWSETNANDKAWEYMDVAAKAQAGTITVFAKVQAPENDSFNHTDLDMVYFDAAHVDLAPSAAITAAKNGTTITATWVGISAPGWSIKGFEVQAREAGATEWITLQNKNQTNTQLSFEGQSGRTYTLRVRPWQRRSESYNSQIDLPGVWVERTVTLGNAVNGRVFNHLGHGLEGVSLLVVSTTFSTTSGSGGAYILPTGSAGAFNIVAADFNGLIAPPTATVTVPANDVAILDLTLRPAGEQQVVTNNDFEIDLAGWQVSNGAAATVAVSAAHTGQGGLLISDTVAISQTRVISDLQNPVVSFWRKNEAPFMVALLAGDQPSTVTPVYSQILNPVDNWTFTLVEAGTQTIYQGAAGLSFSYEGGSGSLIAIDEVSLAAGPYRTYLPALLKAYGEEPTDYE